MAKVSREKLPRLKLVGNTSGVVEISSVDNPVDIPLSPSSVFTHTTLENIPYSYIDAVVLCHWHNILGPHLEHVWYVGGRPRPHHNNLRHVSSQILSGEICRDTSSRQIDFKFYDIPDKGIVVPALVFSALTDKNLGINSIAFLIPNSEVKIYLKQHCLFQSWLTRLIGKFRVFLNKGDCDKGMKMLTLWLYELLKLLSLLQEQPIPPTIKLNYTAFSPSQNIELSFLRKSIASHLMTFGRSLVIGKITEAVNLMILTLAMFNTEKERAVSRLLSQADFCRYHHDLSLQGSLKASDGSFQVPMSEILCAEYPSSIIDMHTHDVKQSPGYQEHTVRRYETMKNELICLHYQQLNASHELTNSVLHAADYPESLVQNLINEICKLPPVCGVREAYVAQFCRILQRKALCLVNYVQNLTQSGNETIRSVKKLRIELSLNLEGDFLIVLAAAEKLMPGIYHIVLGGSQTYIQPDF